MIQEKETKISELEKRLEELTLEITEVRRMNKNLKAQLKRGKSGKEQRQEKVTELNLYIKGLGKSLKYAKAAKMKWLLEEER